uniref:Endonuclease/exonuclease/phosphatase domain-containing protein n=1 Tax=Knipowitschia caucasica TaxID=637954 RepID=A0AAV2KU47_KNICA
MANKEGGGVAIYVKNHIVAHEVRYVQNVTDLEFVVVQVEAPFCALIVTVYRPPTYSVSAFLKNLTALLESLEMLDIQPIIVCGDFNENLLFYGTKPIMEMFESRGYGQLITAATTDRHTLLDAIYISRPQLCTHSAISSTTSPVYQLHLFTSSTSTTPPVYQLHLFTSSTSTTPPVYQLHFHNSTCLPAAPVYQLHFHNFTCLPAPPAPQRHLHHLQILLPNLMLTINNFTESMRR